MNIKDLNILKTHQALKNKEFSFENLVKEFLKSIDKKETEINAFISIFKKQALKQAREKDKKGYKLKSVLDGIPIILKDNILVKNKKCTAGSKILKNYKALYNASVVEKLNKAGAIILGKGNMDEFACGASGETSCFGPTKNPVNTKKVPGGSSSGPAAALAANFALAGLGSDTGGSIREPASFCGVYGLKPSYGRVSRYGLIAMASSLDQIGPMALSLEDLAIMLSFIQGRDKKDLTSLKSNKINYPLKAKDPKDIILGIPKNLVESKNKELVKLFKETISNLQKKGIKFLKVELPHLKYALRAYNIIMPAEVSANLARFDGIRYGLSEKKKDLLDIYKETRGKGFGQEVKARIMLGNYVLSQGFYNKYYLKAQKIRTLIKQDFANIFKKGVNGLFLPTTPKIAFNLREKIGKPIDMYLSDIYTVPANLTGLPALTFPNKNINGLPTGIQIIGDDFDDEGILKTAKTIESLI